VAELRVEPVAVTVVLAAPAILDGIDGSGEARLLRTAPREVMILGPVDLGVSDALVEDVTDGWTAFVVDGEDAAGVLARVCELPAPAPGEWLQGEVAKAPAKVIAEAGRLTILVPAHLAAHVEERLRTDAAEVLA
jgi:hypothetical protein